jgi:U3 small nucleolar ribonucleoprotein protein IMP4
MTDLILIHETRGVPDALIVSHLPHGPTLSMTLSNVTLRHDVSSNADSTVSEQYPHLIFEGFGSKLGDRVKGILGALFPVPKDDAKRVMTFANADDFISFRYVPLSMAPVITRLTYSHHVFAKTSHKDVQLAEVGPRFEAKPYEIRQGTLDQKEADIEWLYRPFMRTAKKKNQL